MSRPKGTPRSYVEVRCYLSPSVYASLHRAGARRQQSVPSLLNLLGERYLWEMNAGQDPRQEGFRDGTAA